MFYLNLEKDLVTHSLQQVKSKGYKRRFIFEGWNNYTEFEWQMINEVKQKMKQLYNCDMESRKEFGPRTADSYVKQGSDEILPGVDFHFSNQLILRFLVARNFDIA